MAVYVKIPKIYKKFKQAETENRVIYVSAPTGYGKSVAFQNYYKRKSYLAMSGRAGKLPDMPKIEGVRQSVVLFDDICFLTDEESKQYVMDMICKGQKTVVLMGRGSLPVWLVKLDIEREFIRADRSDLGFTANETLEYLNKMGLSSSMEMAEMITEKVDGNPILTILYVKNLSGQAEVSEDAYEKALRELYHFYDYSIWRVWNDTLVTALLATCEFETYTVELIERITGLPKLADLIEYAYSIGSFVTHLGNQVYRLDGILREYVKWKRAFVYTQDDFMHMYRNAAAYYEEIDEVELALKYYNKAKMYDKLADILIRNAEFDAARANLFKTRHYIFSLPEETIKNSPALMGSISLVYSVMMCPEDSEKWYNILKEYEMDESRSEEERKDARARIAYLDVSLVHRSSEERVEGLYKAAMLVKEEKLRLPELSFTGNSPSLANGGVDFSHWLNMDKRYAVTFKSQMQGMFGKFGKAIVTVAIAEGLFEQNALDAYEVMTRANTGYMLADAVGRIEICFVAAVLLARQHIVRGQIGVAIEQINSFRVKAERENAKFLMSNLEAFQVWLTLLQGDIQRAKEWLKRAPDENIEFYITDRYRYIQKIRVLMALGELEHAYCLIQRMNVYFEEYNREYFWIQNQLFHAAIVYRTGGEHWEEVLIQALKKAEEYHYVRFVADGGAALLPLLKQLKNKKAIGTEYFAEILNETEKMAKFYPDYMSAENKLKEPLTKKETEILRLMHYGKSSEEICEICKISYSGLKFHNRNIYRKLGVNSRLEAERKAVLMRLVD